MNTQRQTHPGSTSIDPEEVEQFSRIAEQWWDPRGKFKPLHQINPVRLSYIRGHVVRAFGKDAASLQPLQGLSLLDMGCGGGLISEPMARMGAAVTGIDASEKNIKTAALHAQHSGLAIDYRTGTAESLAAQGEQYDVVLALEIIEHVKDPEAFVASCAALVKNGGLLVMSTINRTAKSMLFAKIGAEYVLRLLPIGTHDWRKFIRPDEMAAAMTQNALAVEAMDGMVLRPLSRQWVIDPHDLAVNYLMVARKA